jgi:hypothetical protein
MGMDAYCTGMRKTVKRGGKWLMQIKGFRRCLGVRMGKGVFGMCPKHRFLLVKFISIKKIEQGDKH